jgi:uncharacterized protein Yka (UPF0111/DUF47 family)
MLEMKTLVNQMKTTVDTINRQDQAEERISDTEDKIDKVLQANNHKGKNKYL